MLRYNPILEESDKLSSVAATAAVAICFAANMKTVMTISTVIATAVITKTAVALPMTKFFNDSPEYGNHKADVRNL